MAFKAKKTFNRDEIRASRIFADRTEPRRVFWEAFFNIEDQVRAYAEGAEDEPQIEILNYYGIGGQGKTALLMCIQKELARYQAGCSREDIFNDIRYESEHLFQPEKAPSKFTIPTAFIDFNTAISHRTIDIVYQICDRLSKFGMEFPMVFSAYYQYLTVIQNENGKSQEVEGKFESAEVLKDHPYLALFFDSALKFFPKVSTTVDFASRLKKLYNVRKLEDFHKSVAPIKQLTSVDGIEERLPQFFVEDMNLNLSNQKEPVIICFDTYEKYVSFDMGTSDEFQKDRWLRDLVVRVPGVIWIFSGRDKLVWEEVEKDAGWEEIKSHSLGNLSENDLARYLKSVNIDDPSIVKRISDVSKGVPVYVELCVERYYDIKENGAVPVPDDFTTDITQLFTKYKHSIPDPDLMDFLACLGEWDDKTVEDLGMIVLLNGFSDRKYSACKRHSYITKIADGYYKMHDVIASNFYETCGDRIKNQTIQLSCERYASQLDEYGAASREYKEIFQRFEKMFLKAETVISDEVWISNYKEKLAEGYRKLLLLSLYKSSMADMLAKNESKKIFDSSADSILDLLFSILRVLEEGKKRVRVTMAPGWKPDEMMLSLMKYLSLMQENEKKPPQSAYVSQFRAHRDRMKVALNNEDSNAMVLNFSELASSDGVDVAFVDAFHLGMQAISGMKDNSSEIIRDFPGAVVAFSDRPLRIEGVNWDTDLKLHYQISGYEFSSTYKALLFNELDEKTDRFRNLQEMGYAILIEENAEDFISSYKSETDAVLVSGGKNTMDWGEDVQVRQIKDLLGMEFKKVYLIVDDNIVYIDGRIRTVDENGKLLPEEDNENDKRIRMIYYMLFTRATEGIILYVHDEPLRQYLMRLLAK